MENKESFGVNYERNVKHYIENLTRILGDVSSDIKDLSLVEQQQVAADLLSLKHNLKMGKHILGEEAHAAYQKMYEAFELKSAITVDMSELTEAA